MATTTACEPNRSAIAVMSEGSASAAELSETRSAPDSISRDASSTLRTPPPTVKGISSTSATSRDDAGHRVDVLGRRRDVEQDELVGAAVAVVLGQFDGVTDVAQSHEVDALDDAPVGYVEARDQTSERH